MLLRCQCRALLSCQPLHRPPHVKHYPAYRGKPFSPLNLTKPSPPSTKQGPHQDPDAEPEEFDDDDDYNYVDSIDSIEDKEKFASLMAKQRAKEKEEKERTKRKGARGLEAVDITMSNKDLGLYSGPRERKRNFIRWMVTSGSKHEFFPQAIAMEIESRRVEQMRKRSEERMFKKMNDFFNSLSEEEINEEKLIKPAKIGGKTKERRLYPDPSPFQQLVGDLPPSWEQTKNFESVVLKLLARHNKVLHKQYEEYICWSDYKLQKQALYFKFPLDVRSSPGFRDVVLRFFAIREEAEKLQERKDKEAIGAGKKENITELEEYGDGEVKIPDPGALDELLRLERIANDEAERLETETHEQESLVENAEHPVETTSEANEEPTTSKTEPAPVDAVETPESKQLSEKKTKKNKKQTIDLAYYVGRALPSNSRFTTLPIYKHHYVNPLGDATPFLMNPTFKPWRPIPHSTRLKMFDAWRAGLGLRNVAWLGGVSWRRVDGIIGILKREWEFVEKGGKLENTMAQYMDALLSKTPVIGKPTYNIAPTELVCFPLGNDEDSEYVMGDEAERFKREINAAESEGEEEELDPEAMTAGADEGVEDEQFENEDVEETEDADEEADVEGEEAVIKRLEEIQRQIADGSLNADGIRRLIANEDLDEKAIGYLMADKGLDENEIRQLIAHAKLFESTMRAPDPSHPIIIVPQYLPSLKGVTITDPTEEEKDRANYIRHFETVNKIHAVDREWESSHKEPLIEIPVRRTAQYWAIIQEMEEYSEKRAAQALEGLDGHTLTEKEEGIKMFEQYFGGLRSLGGRDKFQGTPPWEKNFSGGERRRRHLKAERLSRQKPGQKYLPDKIRTTRPMALSPAERFRQSTSTDLSSRPTIVTQPKERVVWRFEDVSWVKQRTIRPRKTSFVGTLDKRVRLESGIERYGPFGIGSGTIEGVGGVKHVIERGLDGHLRMGEPPKKKERVRPDIVV